MSGLVCAHDADQVDHLGILRQPPEVASDLRDLPDAVRAPLWDLTALDCLDNVRVGFDGFFFLHGAEPKE